MKKHNILIFPSGTEVANEIISSLKKHKYFNLHFASSDLLSYCNYRSEEVDFLPFVSSSNFDSRLIQLIKNKNIDIIVPAHDDVALYLSKIEDKIESIVIGQSYNVNKIVRFKDVTYNYFRTRIPVAKTYSDIILQDEFPVFTKPKRGQGSQDSMTLDSIDMYNNFFSSKIRDEFVVMELLPGKEFTIDCFSDNGNLLYFGARTRDRTSRGISVLSTFISNKDINKELNEYAIIISKELSMHGVWFFQMKYDKYNQLKLLEIGPRVSGTMMLNRARGVNFIELALYQALGYQVEVLYNDIEISLARALLPRYKHNLSYNNLYVDFDDTLFLGEKEINTQLMQLIFQCKNEKKQVFLITKHTKSHLNSTLVNFGIKDIFDEIIHLDKNDQKVRYMKSQSVLVDDSFAERKSAINNGIHALSVDNISILIKD